MFSKILSWHILVPVVLLAVLAAGLAQARSTNQEHESPLATEGVTTIPAKISYQGVLTEDSRPVTGSRNMLFKLFTSDDCSGTALQTITKNGVGLQDGHFNLALDVNPAHFDGQGIWLKVEVGTVALGCEEILPAPYALFSASTGALHENPVSGAEPASNQVLKWNGVEWTPSEDADTIYSAGAGLILSHTQFNVNLAGSGSATTVARSDHNHFGQSWSGSATNGLAISNSGAGVAIYGNATASTDNTKGVYGRSASSDGAGVYGFAAANPGTTSYGVVGHHFWGGTGVGAWSYAGRLYEGRSGDYPGGTLRFYVTNSGDVHARSHNIFVSSSKTTSTTSNEYSTLYALQSPEAWFEDFGTANLVEGEALVLIEPHFAVTVNLDSDYHVFLTPMGDSNGLYIQNQTPASFEVREANGGRSTISFHYRVVAKRQGFEGLRLETIFIEELPQQERDEINPHD
jgi:hypothetical protein